MPADGRVKHSSRKIGGANHCNRALIVVALATVVLSVLVAAHVTRQFDEEASRSVLGMRSSSGNIFWGAITQMGSYWAVAIAAAICALLLYRFRNRRDSVTYLALVGAGAAAAELLKLLIARPRPDLLMNLAGEGYSYPSSHTMAAVACYLGFAWFVSKSKMSQSNKITLHAAGWGTVALVGFSRIYLGWHYATDVLGSILIGLCLVMLFDIILGRWQELSRQPCSARRPLLPV